MATLLAMLDRTAVDGRQVALIQGEAGIGKSRLLLAVLDAAADRSFGVFLGVARELEQDRPFGVLAQALGLESRSADPERAAIARMLTGETGGAAQGGPELRFRILETLIDLVERLCADGPILLALEDLHWADESSLLTVGHLASRLADRPFALIATCRPVPQRVGVERVVEELSSGAGLLIRLPPLDDASIQAITQRAIGAEPDADVLQALARTGGNPLFALELASALVEDGSIRVEAGRAGIGSINVPPSLHVTILRRLRFLPQETLDVLQVATMLGSSFSVADLSTILERPVADLTAPLDVALAAGVLGEDHDRLAFRHDLVRDALYEDQPLAIRKGLHVQAGRRLGAAGASSVQVATQLALGASPGDAEAVRWLRTAARDISAHAPTVAAGFLGRAVELMDPRDPDRDATLVDLILSLTWAGDLEQARRRAYEVLARTRDVSMMAAIHYALAKAWVWAGRPAESLEAVENVLALPDLPESDRALALAEMALRLCHSRDVVTAYAIAEMAEAAAERSGNSGAAFTALCAKAVSSELLGHFNRAADLAVRAVAVAEEGPGGESPIAEFYLGQSLIGADRLEEAGAALESLRLTRLNRQQTGMIANQGAVQAGQLFLAARWDEAVVVAESSVGLSADSQFRALLVRAIAVLAHIAIHRDDLAGAEALLEQAEREIALSGPGRWGITWLLWARALLLEARGDLDGALAVLGGTWDLCAMLGSIGEYRDIAPNLARMAAAAGDRDRARATAEGAEQLALIGHVPTARGAALLCRGLLEDDSATLMAAVETYRKGPRPIDLAIACEQAAARAGRVDAAPLLQEALAVYENVGARRDIARVDATLRSAGVRRGSRRPRRAATSGWDSLTSSELEVVGLVASGLRNTEIAARLYVSRRTVETHLTHVFAKLGLSSRVQLTAEAVRRSGRLDDDPPAGPLEQRR